MKLNIGDIVTRKSHNNDIYFKIIDINNDIANLKGIDVRLIADSNLSDLTKVVDSIDSYKEDRKLIKDIINSSSLERGEFFYLPGKILHIDGDDDYLERCIRFYKNMKLEAYGISINEKDIKDKIMYNLEKYRPDIVVITGHDALIKDKKYQNSNNFIDAVKEARKYEKSHDKLIIIAGACQSNYEELIKAGANFASSPKRINIHALDPAIIASSIALSEKNKSLDLLTLLRKTKYGSDGIGGIITNGMMYVGFPR